MFIRGKNDPLQLISFLSYGTDTQLFARGRALEDPEIDLGQKGMFRLIFNSWERFDTDQIRDCPLLLRLPDGRSLETKTDSQGYFLVDARAENLSSMADPEGWVPYELSFAAPDGKRRVLSDNRFSGTFLIPSDSARFGIISDIDDTILHTGVTSYMKWQVIINTLFKHAESRIPLHGAAELYQKLHAGTNGNQANPVFYVSHSPWNLYRYLEYFLKKNHFPKGPILLRSMASLLSRKKTPGPHKQLAIENILQTYKDLPFILIGDSGERDADIYLEITRKFPGRIKAIFLRTVRHRKRMKRVRGLLAQEKQTPAFLVDDSWEFLAHARKLGLV